MTATKNASNVVSTMTRLAVIPSQVGKSGFHFNYIHFNIMLMPHKMFRFTIVYIIAKMLK